MWFLHYFPDLIARTLDRGFGSRLRHGCLSSSFYVVLSCVGRGLATSWLPVQGVPTVCRNRSGNQKIRGGEGPKLDFRSQWKKITSQTSILRPTKPTTDAGFLFVVKLEPVWFSCLRVIRETHTETVSDLTSPVKKLSVRHKAVFFVICICIIAQLESKKHIRTEMFLCLLCYCFAAHENDEFETLSASAIHHN
jgi:hypothetical protein